MNDPISMVELDHSCWLLERRRRDKGERRRDMDEREEKVPCYTDDDDILNFRH